VPDAVCIRWHKRRQRLIQRLLTASNTASIYMKYLIYLIAIIILLGVNLGLFNNLQIQSQIPNLLFLLTLFFALEKKDYDFFFIALISGIFLDFFSAGFFGGFTLAFLAVAFGAHLVAANLLVAELNWKTLSLALLGALVFFNLTLWAYGLAAFKLSFSLQYIGIKIFTSRFLASFFYNWLLLYPVYLFFTFLHNFVDNLNIRRRGVVR
jgi:cell shape-determining protein MreD